MILARRRNGNLAVATSACGLPKVPAEIWNIIKQYRALELVGEEEDHFLCNLHAKSPCGNKPPSSWFVSRSTPRRECRDCELMFQNEGMAKLFSTHREVSVAPT